MTDRRARDNIAALVEALGLERFVLVVRSGCAIVALHCANPSSFTGPG